ncbi:MAG: hypothetical protein KJO40_13675 [Deltaproteobacteria bacterium]|nr:hypothetical protein [Deltaproteobacteria bacterium]
MEPLPAIALGPDDWPDANEDGTTTLGPELAAHFLAMLMTLIDYLERQHARCAETPN